MPTRVSLSGNTDLDSKNKDKGESEYEDFFGEQFELQFQEIQDRLNTKEPEALPNSFWEKWGSIFMAFVIPTFTAFQLDGAKTQMETLNIGVDWDSVTDQAANFSSSYAFTLVTGINDASQRHLQKSLTDFFQSPERDVDALIQNISTRFGETRAENIAITEVTRGYERGKDIYTDELWKLGVKAEPMWNTMDDEKVCVICEPNDGVRKSEGWTADGIPPHPRCRCWTTLVVVEKR